MKKALMILMFAVLSVLSAVPPTNGLVAWYPCNERSSGTGIIINDRSGSSNNFYSGVLSSATRVHWTDTAKDSSAVSFDGATVKIKAITVTPFNFNNALTISVWVYLPWDGGLTAYNPEASSIISKRNAYFFGFRNSTITASFMAPDSQWHGFSFSCDTFHGYKWYNISVSLNISDSTRALYLNGKKMPVTAYRGYPTSINVSNDSLALGYPGYLTTVASRIRGELSGSFAGIVDEIRIYNRALTDAEVFDVYHEFDPANLPPEITSNPPASSVYPGQTYTYQVVATDPNAQDVLTYSLVSAPTGMTVSAAGLITWATTQANIGLYMPSVKVTDQLGAYTTQSFTVEVKQDDVLKLLDALPSTYYKDTLYTVVMPAVTDSGDSIDYAFLSKPTEMQVLGRNLVWYPTILGTDTIKAVVTIGSQKDTLTKVVTVLDKSAVLMPVNSRVIDKNIFTVQSHMLQVNNTKTILFVYDPAGRAQNIRGNAYLQDGMYVYRGITGDKSFTGRFCVR